MHVPIPSSPCTRRILNLILEMVGRPALDISNLTNKTYHFTRISAALLWRPVSFFSFLGLGLLFPTLAFLWCQVYKQRLWGPDEGASSEP